MSVVIDGFVMDLAVTEGHRFPAQATSFPVEQGAEFGDHIRELPDEITLESIVSDTPIGEIATDPTRRLNGDQVSLPSEAAYAKLLEIRRAARPVAIVTSRGTFESMALIDLDVPNDNGKSGGLFFTAKFQRFRVITNKRTRVRVQTAMPVGAKTAKKTVEQFQVVNDRIIWNIGNPPGAPLRPGYEWAEVQAVKSKLALGVSDDVRTLLKSYDVEVTRTISNPTGIAYRYTGNGSTNVRLTIKAGEMLTAAATAAFELDLARDRRALDAENRKRLAAGQYGQRDTLRTPKLPKKGLPTGTSIERFKRNAPATGAR